MVMAEARATVTEVEARVVVIAEMEEEEEKKVATIVLILLLLHTNKRYKRTLHGINIDSSELGNITRPVLHLPTNLITDVGKCSTPITNKNGVGPPLRCSPVPLEPGSKWAHLRVRRTS